MKKVVLFIVALMSVLTMNAETKKSVKLSFDKQQFSFVKNSVGAVRVVSNSINGCYASDVSQPGLPLFAVNVGVPNDVSLNEVSTTYNKQLIYDDVVVAANSVSVHAGYTNARSVTINTDKAYSVCITKQNYIPYYYELVPSSGATNKITSCTTNKANNSVGIAAQLADNTQNAEIVISSAVGNRRQTYTCRRTTP